MRIVLISDTHELHDELVVPDGDLLIHAGDFTMNGASFFVKRFADWIEQFPHKNKVVIAGNHDITFDPDYTIGRGYDPKCVEMLTSLKDKGVHYLNDSGVEIDGIKIWGSPIQPWFFNWAFNRRRGPEINEHWLMIPSGTDVLVTHGPPNGVLDQPFGRGEHAGCRDLMLRVMDIKPKLHVFGHIHGSYGIAQRGGTTFVNASVVDEAYRVVNAPIVFDLEVEHGKEEVQRDEASQVDGADADRAAAAD